MDLIGLGVIAFGAFISLLAIFTRPGTSTKPADRAAHGEQDKHK